MARQPKPKHPELQYTIVMERAHFPSAFLEKLKSKVSGDNPCHRPYTTFECLTAHLWRKITRVRNLEEELTTKVKGLLSKPVRHAARLIHDAVAQVDGDYFRSFIDFSSSKEKMEGLVPSAYGGDVLSPDLEVSSWLNIPFYDMDFGTNPPRLFVPSYERVEGFLHIVPSFSGNGDVDAFVSLFEKDMRSFIDGLYYLD
ncbi:putrescine hydroxycinnamoyltransferase-like [Nymphaea colorata]|uniref:putrescine hydroxycinnamoyltransferase-like n=1 Tax=Nymphaea colorata TaxID=210225 RepID=UPI00129E3619|nr:putrescine hydroxycinnamoyltransferase-like [Nymphaea colorata]